MPFDRVSDNMREEMLVARWSYHCFTRWFATKYTTLVEGRLISPIAVCRRSLVDFFAGVLSFAGMARGRDVFRSCGEDLHELLKNDHSKLIPAFNTRIEHCILYWTGPDISIRLQRPGDSEHLSYDFVEELMFKSEG